MPMDYSRYPADWKTISLRIRERDRNCCKWCKVKNGAVGAWHPLIGQWWSEQRWVGAWCAGIGIDAARKEGPHWWPRKMTKVVLTVAHLGSPRDGCPQCGKVYKEPGECLECGVTLVEAPGDKHDKMDVRDENLAALCQRCHLNFDRDEHAANATKTRERKREAREPSLPGIMIAAKSVQVCLIALVCAAALFPVGELRAIGPLTMKRVQKELATSEPNLPELREQFLDAIERRDRSIFNRQRVNYEARYCVWSHQSRDGKKWSAALGQKPFPWPGASDARVGLVDKYVNEDVAFLMVVSDRMRVMVSGTESNDAAFAHRATNLLRWMKQTQMTELARERRLGANYLLENGATVFGVFWERKQQLGYEVLDLEDMAGMAMQLQQQAAQGAELPPGAEMLLALPTLIQNPRFEDQAVAALRVGFPTVRESKLRDAVRELREKGTARLPRPQIIKNCPVVVALRPNEEVFIPPDTTDLQTARGVYRRELLSESQLVEREETHGWSAKWIKEMLRTQRGNVTLDIEAQYNRGALRATTVTSSGLLTTKHLFEVVHAYRRMHDADGVPGIFYTCFNPRVVTDKAYHGLLDYDHGELPFIHIERECRSRLLDDARGYGEVAFTWQQQIKTQWDARVDRASLATLPPSYYPSGMAPDKWGPGVQIPTISRDDYGFLDIPKYDPGSQEVEESVRRFADEYFGRPVDEQNAVQAQVMRQDLSNIWMNGMARVDTQLFKLCQQFLPDEIYFRVVGSSQAKPLKTTKDEIQGQFDVSVGYNVSDFDNEVVTAKLGLIEKAMMMDVNGRIDRNQALDVVFGLIDPDIGERILKPALDASQAEIEDEQTVFAKLMAGVDVDVKPEGQAYDLRLKVLENIFATNPKAQQAYQQDERVKEVTDKRVKQLQFQLQQRENAQIGRLGA